MKRFSRNTFVAILLSPLILFVHLASLIAGRQRTVSLVGPALTRAAKGSLRYWVPEIEGPEDFGLLSPKMRARLWLWKPFYDIMVVEDTAGVFGIRVSNCPLCEVLNGAGLRELSPYACAGDWEKARDNADKWEFERTHQIGTGDAYCDHTYRRKTREQ